MAAEEASRATVEVRVFRGSRRRSVYRELTLDPHVFQRLLAAARHAGLPCLAGLDRTGPWELGKNKASLVAQELRLLRTGGELIELDRELAELAELAAWSARSRQNSWLQISRRRNPAA